MVTRGLGWKPDLPAHIASTPFTDVSKLGAKKLALPKETNNRACRPLIRDQSATSMCTGFGFTSAIHTRLKILGYDPAPFSPRAAYAVGRMLGRSNKKERLVDDGAYPNLVADGIKRFGLALESQFSFTDDIHDVNDEPDLATFANASQFRLQSFSRIAQTKEARANAAMIALAAGHTIPLGMMVGPAFMDHKGDFPLDIEPEDTYLGGHMSYLIDYEDNGEVFWGVTSYGEGYGYKGMFCITRNRLMHSSTSDLYNVIVTA